MLTSNENEMKGKNIIAFIFFSFFTLYYCDILFADTIRHMQYNLLYYTYHGVETCNATTNNLDTKDSALRAIIHFVQPDVLTVNEIGKGDSYAERILTNALNTDGINYYRTLPISTASNMTIGNRIFYDSRKLAMKNNFKVSTDYTYFNGYKMYYLSEELFHGDTAFITFIICHLKAGSDMENDPNEQRRANQVRRLITRLQTMPIENYVLSGDFNVYNASEEAFDLLVVHPEDETWRFYDPIDRIGEWDNNADFADVFTQSTHITSNGCPSYGGMDNRFDFILVNDYIKNGIDKIRCLPNTYYTLGNDGHRYNNSILTDPINSSITPYGDSVPANIIQALYTMSDHLPVIMDYVVDAHIGITEQNNCTPIIIQNPIHHQLKLSINQLKKDQLNLNIYNINGQIMYHEQHTVDAGNNYWTIPFPYPSGCYILRVTNQQGQTTNQKIIKL